ncbi:MAG: DHHW family protein [Clostridium sp.]
MNRKQAIWVTIPFLIIVFGFTAYRYIKPDYYESKYENRLLSQKPIKDKTGDLSYTEAYEKYVTDQFPLRERMVKGYIKSEIISGKTDVKGYYLQEDGWIFKKNDVRLSEEDAKEYSDKINEYTDILTKKGKKVYYASTPQKENILVNRMPSYSNVDILNRNSERFLNGIDKEKVNVINVREDFINKFSSNEIENFYFKTDNHWNGFGAYEGFKSIMSGMGIEIDDKDYSVTTLKDKKFVGIYNKNLYNIYPENDRVSYVYRKDSKEREYYLHNKNELVKVPSNKIIGTGINGEDTSYSMAYTGTSIYYKVHNPSAPIKEKLLIFRDSYFSPMTWLFEDMFQEVEVVDPRYIERFNKNTLDIAKTTDADRVLMMYNDFGFITMISEM